MTRRRAAHPGRGARGHRGGTGAVRDRTRSWAALGGVLGPAAFVAGWITGAAMTNRSYSSIDDPISRLAAVGADSRPVMTAGFVGFGLGLPLYASALRDATDGPAWLTAAVTGLATLGVAATPLERSTTIDSLHGLFAGLGYIALAATPLLAVRPLARSGRRILARAGLVSGSVSAVSLALTTTSLPSGLLQRLGLTATHAWIAGSAALLACGHTPRQTRDR